MRPETHLHSTHYRTGCKSYLLQTANPCFLAMSKRNPDRSQSMTFSMPKCFKATAAASPIMSQPNTTAFSPFCGCPRLAARQPTVKGSIRQARRLIFLPAPHKANNPSLLQEQEYIRRNRLWFRRVLYRFWHRADTDKPAHPL